MLGEPTWDVHRGENTSTRFLCGGYTYDLTISHQTNIAVYYCVANYWAIILAYDLGSLDSWEEVLRLHSVILDAFGDKRGSIPVMVLGLKADLVSGAGRVPRAQTETFAHHHGYLYSECSARTGEGVREAFGMLVERTYAGTIAYEGDPSRLRSSTEQNFQTFAKAVQAINPPSHTEHTHITGDN